LVLSKPSSVNVRISPIYSSLSIVKLKELDPDLRKLIDRKIGGLPLIKEVFYRGSKDWGFSMDSLHHRYCTCKIENLEHLLSRDISLMMRKYIAQVAIDRKV
jgi:hypothetical protein